VISFVGVTFIADDVIVDVCLYGTTGSEGKYADKDGWQFVGDKLYFILNLSYMTRQNWEPLYEVQCEWKRPKYPIVSPIPVFAVEASHLTKYCQKCGSLSWFVSRPTKTKRVWVYVLCSMPIFRPGLYAIYRYTAMAPRRASAISRHLMKTAIARAITMRRNLLVSDYPSATTTTTNCATDVGAPRRAVLFSLMSPLGRPPLAASCNAEGSLTKTTTVDGDRQP